MKAAKKRGQPVPDVIKNRPLPEPELAYMLELFHLLGTDRQLSMAPGPIPWSSFMDWCDRYRAPVELHDYLWGLIQAMEAVFQKHVQKKTKTNA